MNSQEQKRKNQKEKILNREINVQIIDRFKQGDTEKVHTSKKTKYEMDCNPKVNAR